MKSKNLKLLYVVPFLFTLLLFSNSCKKELLVSEASHRLTTSEVKQWYISKYGGTSHSDNTQYRTMSSGSSNRFSPMWDLATENLSKNEKEVVAIPLNKGTKLSFGNYGFRKLLVYKNDQGELEGKVMEVIFGDNDVKERKYNDLYDMSKFNGKVILYDMSMHFKTGYNYKNGKPDRIISLDLSNNTTDTLARRPNSNNNIKVTDFNVVCFREYIDPNNGYFVPGCDCEGYWVTYCQFVQEPIPWIIDFVPIAPQNPGGGPDPVPTPYYGFYGSLPDPCDTDPNSPVFVICDDAVSNRVKQINELNLVLGLNSTGQNYLLNNFDMVNVIKNYLNTSGGATQQNVTFIQWAIDYLIANPSFDPLSTGSLQKLFLIKNLNLAQDEFNYVNTHGAEAIIIASLFNEDSNTAESITVAEAVVEYLTDEQGNTSSTTGPKLTGLKQLVRNAISQGIVASAKVARKIYLVLNKLSQTHPGIVTTANTFLINPIRNEVNTQVNYNAQTLNWTDLFLIWAFELGNYPVVNNDPTISITGNANLITGNNINNPQINAFKNLKSVLDLKTDVKNKLMDGTLQAGGTDFLYYVYNVNEYYGSLAEQNMAKIFLGSFGTTAVVLSKTGNSATVKFTAPNLSGWESATRFIKAEKGGNIGIIDNKPRGTGLNMGGNLGEVFEWIETINW